MNKKIASDRDRIRQLAKKFAQSEGVTVALYKRDNGTFDFSADMENKNIVEYITPY